MPDDDDFLVDDTSDVYDASEREELEEADELESWEEGFMEGAEGDGQRGKCANCGAALTRRSTIEREVSNRVQWFCSSDCVDEFLDKQDQAE